MTTGTLWQLWVKYWVLLLDPVVPSPDPGVLNTNLRAVSTETDVLRVLTDDGHKRVEVADVDALLGDVHEVLDHAYSVLLLQML